jgi:hypothetical protein
LLHRNAAFYAVSAAKPPCDLCGNQSGLPLMPILLGMKQAKNLDLRLSNTIDNEVGQTGHHDFASALHRSLPAGQWELPQVIDDPLDTLRNTAGGNRIVMRDVLAGRP